MRRTCGLVLGLLSAALAFPAGAQDLTQIQTLRDGADGLAGARALAVSPDGLFAYVAATAENAIGIFGVDPVDGRWAYLGKVVDGEGGVDGIGGVIDLAVSPEGSRLYAVGETDDAVATFDRSSTSGALTFEGVIRDGEAGADFLDRPVALSVVPSGSDAGRVFVVSFGESALTALDPTFSGLAWVGSWVNGDDAEGMGFPTDVVALAGSYGADVYVTAQTSASLSEFTTSFTGTFAQREVHYDGTLGVDGLANPQAIAAAPTGEALYVAAAGESAVSTFVRSPSNGALTFWDVQRDGVGGVFGIGSVLGVFAEPEGENVYATGGFGLLFNFIPQIATFGVNAFDDTLDFAGAINLASYSSFVFYVPPPRISLAFPSAGEALVAHPVHSTLAVYDRDANGALALDTSLEDGAGTRGTKGAQVVVASPDGANVYVLGRDEALVTELARDTATGQLSFVGLQERTGLLLPITPRYRNATMSPDGKNLYVFDYRQRRISIYRRDVVPGRLVHEEDVVSNAGGIVPEFLQFDSGSVSPDGGRLYVLSPLQNAISVFVRSPLTGVLAYQRTHYENPDLQLGMLQPQSILAGPNGDVYVGGSANVHDPIRIRFASDGSVVATEKLTFQVGQTLCGGISLAADEAFTRIVTGQYGNQVCSYRVGANGSLVRAGAAFVPGKQGYVESVAVAPDGRRAHAALYDGAHPNVGHSALASFTLDASTAAITHVQTLSDENAGVDDTQGLVSIAVSPDGRHVYGAAYLDDAVVAFAPEPGAAALALCAMASLAAAAGRRARA